MSQYYGSTSPQSANSTVSQNYSNFNGINTPALLSTGTVSMSGSVGLSGTIDASGTFTSTGAMNLTGTNSYYIVGSSSASLAGSSQSTAISYTVPTVGIQSLLPAGSSVPFYLLDAPSAGKRVGLYCLTAATSHPCLVYVDSATSLAVYFKNAGSGVHTSSNCLMTMYRGNYVELTGYSTFAWLITAVSTWGATGPISLSSST